MRTLKKTAQITIEYLLILGLVIMVLSIIFAKKDSSLQKGVSDTVDGSKDMIIKMIDDQIPE